MPRGLELPLPELNDTSRESFIRAWTRFQLVAVAKEWEEEQQLTILPTLLRGKLVDYYVELPDEAKASLQRLKDSLMKRAGFCSDPLVAGKDFMSCIQRQGEKVEDFVARLTKLFKQAFESVGADSSVLLQRFIMGLLPHIVGSFSLRANLHGWRTLSKGP